jgi:hypothetical protein
MSGCIRTKRSPRGPASGRSTSICRFSKCHCQNVENSYNWGGSTIIHISKIVVWLRETRELAAPKVGEHILYQYIFRNGLEGLNPADAAAPLTRVVLRLREDPVDRWAPSIHSGIWGNVSLRVVNLVSYNRNPPFNILRMWYIRYSDGSKQIDHESVAKWWDAVRFE